MEKNSFESINRRRIHIIKRGKKWAVRFEFALRASKLFHDKNKAIEYAINHYKHRGWEIVIHKKDGTIEKMFNPTH